MSRHAFLSAPAALLLAGVLVLGAGTAAAQNTAKATFAGGCFWCTESPFDAMDGVISTTSGYIGGPEENLTYEQVSSGASGHAEAVEVVHDPSKVTYERAH